MGEGGDKVRVVTGRGPGVEGTVARPHRLLCVIVRTLAFTLSEMGGTEEF